MGVTKTVTVRYVCDRCGRMEGVAQDSSEAEWQVPDGWWSIDQVRVWQRQGANFSPATLHAAAIVCSSKCLSASLVDATNIPPYWEIPF